MRRFLLQVLPGGFCRNGRCGLLANCTRKASLALARGLLGTPTPKPDPVPAEAEDAAIKPPTFVCQHCGRALLVLQTLIRGQAIRGPPGPKPWTLHSMGQAFVGTARCRRWLGGCPPRDVSTAIAVPQTRRERARARYALESASTSTCVKPAASRAAMLKGPRRRGAL